MTEKEWRVIPGYSRYGVTEDGEIWDTQREQFVSQCVNGGFKCCGLLADGASKTTLVKVHRVLAEVFIPNPQQLNRVEHIDTNKLNNNLLNLRWKPLQVKPERTPREEWVLEFRGESIPAKKFANMNNITLTQLRGRLSNGWTTGDICAGFKAYSGVGIQTDTHWFPTLRSKEAHEAKIFIEVRDSRRIERAIAMSKSREKRESRRKYGVGLYRPGRHIGIVDRAASRAYTAWDGILSRCYNGNNKSYARYGGRGVAVCEEWHDFQNFADWFEAQYKEDGWHIDKDFLSEGQLLYSPNTCLMIPDAVNVFLASSVKMQGVYKGVGHYSAQITTASQGYKHKRFSTESEAVDWLIDRKRERARELADEYRGRIDSRLQIYLDDLPVRYQFSAENK